MGKLHFVKMHGCGNDYIYFDCFGQNVSAPEKAAQTLSDRHMGIGGDGIILICPSCLADAKMRMFNADGSEGRMCGNAIRCVAKYLYESGICKKAEMTVETLSGVKALRLCICNGTVLSVTVNMGKPLFAPASIPMRSNAEKAIGMQMLVGGEERTITCLSMGNPHCVIFNGDITDEDVLHLGKAIENDPLFPDRINVEFVRVEDKNTLYMRVWERGSGETLACGTGACAAAVAAVENGFCSKNEDITVKLLGGELGIRYSDDGVLMTGGAVKVFEGDVEL